MPHREENANTVVAQVLRYLLRVKVKAESSGRADRRLLDIHIPDYGAVLEAKYNNFDEAVKAAAGRWSNMNPPPKIVGAVSYHPDFRKNPAKAILGDAPVEFSLVGDRHADMHSRKRVGTVYDLAQSLRRPNAILNPGVDEVDEAVNRISGALSMFWEMIQSDKGTLEKMARILQANFEGYKKSEVLEQSARVGGLILFGAVLFQSSLAQVNAEVSSPWNQTVAKMRRHWQFILEKINYAAILGVATRLLGEGAINPVATKILVKTAEDMTGITGDGHDLLGNIYHRLLIDAKPLGAFYTSVPAATLMAGLALQAEDWGDDKQWANLGFIKKFRIADPACGSGTLLAAACWQMRDNFSRADAKINSIKLNGGNGNGGHPLREAQKILLENSIWGYDILETAGHLTATTLGLIAPDVDFHKAHIYRTIIGKTAEGVAVGSLEMLERTAPIFTRDRQVETAKSAEPIPELDLCIMNPPFVRPTAKNLSFAFLQGKERDMVRRRMKEMSGRHQFSTDGQGPAFIALICHQRAKSSFIRPGGRAALILPATFAVGMGGAWEQARTKMEKHFDLETLIVSRDSTRSNFSESTNLQECIIIARKRKLGERKSKKTLIVSLWRNPRNTEEALSARKLIMDAQYGKANMGDLSENSARLLSDNKIGEFRQTICMGKSAWRGISFANMQLARVADNLIDHGHLKPLAPKGEIRLRQLGEIATIGSNRLHKYITDPDRAKRYACLSPTQTPYCGYFPGHYKKKPGNQKNQVRQISEKPHCYVLPLPSKEAWVENYYKKAGRVVIAESFRFNTTYRLAALVSEPVQAAHYWPIKLHKESVAKLKVMTLWLNSTPALLLIAHFVQPTDKSKVNLSQAAAAEMPVLDVESLGAAKLRKLAAVFDGIAKGPGLFPLPNMKHDEERIKIDAAICEVCGLSDLSSLRAALAAEPIITNQPAGVAVE